MTRMMELMLDMMAGFSGFDRYGGEFSRYRPDRYGLNDTTPFHSLHDWGRLGGGFGNPMTMSPLGFGGMGLGSSLPGMSLTNPALTPFSLGSTLPGWSNWDRLGRDLDSRDRYSSRDRQPRDDRRSDRYEDRYGRGEEAIDRYRDEEGRSGLDSRRLEEDSDRLSAIERERRSRLDRSDRSQRTDRLDDRLDREREGRRDRGDRFTSSLTRDPIAPYSGYEGLDGVWFSPSGERWQVKQNHFILYHATGGDRSEGVFRIEEDWIIAQLSGSSGPVEFQFRQMDDLLLIRGTTGKVMVLQRGYSEPETFNWE